MEVATDHRLDKQKEREKNFLPPNREKIAGGRTMLTLNSK